MAGSIVPNAPLPGWFVAIGESIKSSRGAHRSRAEGLWALSLKDFAPSPSLRCQGSIDTKEERDEQHSCGTRLVAV
jgi:hypothetical protein